MSELLDTGVYCWFNNTSGKLYVGSASETLRGRYAGYLKAFAKGKCHNSYLLRAWIKYGPGAFLFIVLERCPPEQCLERETWWIARFDSTDRTKGYNICRSGSNCAGAKRSPETIAKMLGRHLSKEHRQALIESNRTRVWTPEMRRRHAEAIRAAWKDPGCRARMIVKKIGSKASPETRAKMSCSQKARHAARRKRDRDKILALLNGGGNVTE